ncbi:MAG: HTH domain-containing protein [Paludibacter sp.]|nr:HTH domain-containing protein [Paludibacter sp.]
MNFIKNMNRVEKLHELILQQKTGNPKELSQRLGISRATLYVLIDELNALNLQVAYSRKYETFYYEWRKNLTYKSFVTESQTIN